MTTKGQYIYSGQPERLSSEHQHNDQRMLRRPEIHPCTHISMVQCKGLALQSPQTQATAKSEQKQKLLHEKL
jgi:hypothetical protein